MLTPILIGFAAGVAAALLFLAPIGGSMLAFPLFVLTPLPIAIAALGWGTAAGAVALLAGGLAIAVALGVYIPAAIFALVFAGPMLWLSHLAGLSRSVENNGASAVEWYPTGRLLLHAGIAVSVSLVVAGMLAGYDPEFIASMAVFALDEFLATAPPMDPAPTADTLRPFVDFYVATLPFTLAMFMLAVVVLNLWLGARIARASRRMVRAAERLWMVAPPNEILIGFGVSLMLALFLDGPIGNIAAVFAGAFGCALVLVGLAVLHALTQGMSGRGFLLGATYALILFSGLPLLLFVVLGAAENFIRLRARRFGAAPPTST